MQLTRPLREVLNEPPAQSSFVFFQHWGEETGLVGKTSSSIRNMCAPKEKEQAGRAVEKERDYFTYIFLRPHGHEAAMISSTDTAALFLAGHVRDLRAARRVVRTGPIQAFFKLAVGRRGRWRRWRWRWRLLIRRHNPLRLNVGGVDILDNICNDWVVHQTSPSC